MNIPQYSIKSMYYTKSEDTASRILFFAAMDKLVPFCRAASISTEFMASFVFFCGKRYDYPPPKVARVVMHLVSIFEKDEHYCATFRSFLSQHLMNNDLRDQIEYAGIAMILAGALKGGYKDISDASNRLYLSGEARVAAFKAYKPIANLICETYD